MMMMTLNISSELFDTQNNKKNISLNCKLSLWIFSHGKYKIAIETWEWEIFSWSKQNFKVSVEKPKGIKWLI